MSGRIERGIATPFLELADEFEEDAGRMREYGLDGAEMLDKVAERVRDVTRTFFDRLLSPVEVATLTGISYDTVLRRVKRGALKNRGWAGKPKIRLGDLYGVPEAEEMDEKETEVFEMGAGK